MPEKQPQTIVIDNFTGTLTRVQNGPLNSGLAIFGESYGYNPFVEPPSLRWNPGAEDITAALNGLLLAGKTRVESGILYLYGITNTGHFVKIRTDTDAITDLHTLSTGTPTFNYGSSLEFYNAKVWISNDKGLSTINFDGTGETQVGTWSSSNFIQSTYHPLRIFQGKLYVGNTTDGTVTNIGEIDTTNLIVNNLRLSPPLPTGTFIQDMDLATDFSYLVMSASEIPPENLVPASPGVVTVNAFGGSSYLFKWNGTDQGITSGTTLPNFGIKALNYFGDQPMAFMYDFFGASLYSGIEKIRSTPFNTAPFPSGVTSMGNLAVWGASDWTANLFFYGKFDEEIPSGFWQLYKRAPGGGFINTVPFVQVAVNQVRYVDSNGAGTSSESKLYFSEQFVATGGAITNKLYSLSIPAPEDDLVSYQNPQFGLYTTQRQVFEEKILVKQVRVYCEGTIANNGFNLTLYGPEGDQSFDYAFAAGSDITKLQGSLTRINFNPSEMPPVSELGLAIENTGTRNMRISKIEIDVTPSGK